MEAVVLFAMYLFVVVALPLAVSAIVGFRGLPRGQACPGCSEATLPVISRPLRALARLHVRLPLQRRWCPVCEWDGYARPADAPVIVMAPRVAPARQTRQVRTLELGGQPWQVLLESWREADRYCGRLLFVGPSGRQWHDSTGTLTAESERDLVQQARSLSEPLLAYRLRDVISG